MTKEEKEEKEEWRDIPGYEGRYQVSDLGRVKSLPKEWIFGKGGVRSHNGKLLKQSIDGRGYLLVGLCKNGKKHFGVHALVAMAFHNHTPDGHKVVVDHKDNDKLNNRADNLQLTTKRHSTSKDRGGTSKYTGVCWNKADKKWRAQIRINGKKKYLGSFDKEEDASKAYQKKLREISD